MNAHHPAVYLKLITCFLTILVCNSGTAVAAEYLSCPPVRDIPGPSDRAMDKGPSRFVDAARGDDTADGSEAKPWRTIGYALAQLHAGDTLYLRGGTYYENVYCALIGREDAPITIRSYPKEQAILDGGMREFFDDPAKSWEPFTGGGSEEYRSTKAYPNLRDFIGRFGDSMVGLQTYWHAIDLRATRSDFMTPDGKPAAGKDNLPPVYAGPGVWYDRETGYIHARLAHVKDRVCEYAGKREDYTGVTDPRKVPLILAPYKSVPLWVDGAQHVRFQDLTIRGGGYDTVVLNRGNKLEFDNCSIFTGTYGIRARNIEGFRFHRSGLYGNCPPWATRRENGLATYNGLPNRRDIARLTGHALLVTEGFQEFSVFAFPHSKNWEISYSEFTDCHDAVYLGGLTGSFHHNIIDEIQDDGIYISPMYATPQQPTDFRIHDNRLSRILTVFAEGGPVEPSGTMYIYRNVLEKFKRNVGGHGKAEHVKIVKTDPDDASNTKAPEATEVGRRGKAK